MTIDEARVILGKAAEGMCEELLQAEIYTATLFKDIFLELHNPKN